ncbi:hypothetical protein GO730_16835 [Spirosoma sp. HMF3257]|uniref:hypothetical protein n=1 Tax=Spirosoma telluris TaxID=2183553 RepID=UPI0012FB80BD|nr:hypothetical protein [Spirosoma telluris]
MTQNQQLPTDPIVDMDDTTGSNGGSAEDRFSGESDDTGDNGEDQAAQADTP